MSTEKLGLGLSEAVKVSGVGRNSLLEAIHNGRLRSARIGKQGSQRPRFLILRRDLETYLEGLTQGDAE